FTTVVAAIVAFVALSSSADAACICNAINRGRYCGENPAMVGCKAGYLYNCNGKYGSVGRENGRCGTSCVVDVLWGDYCAAN
ncbi:hypothetical protein DFQ27_009175, partial [Actinomortierella ambigua]